jgi:hypothetical protein
MALRDDARACVAFDAETEITCRDISTGADFSNVVFEALG